MTELYLDIEAINAIEFVCNIADHGVGDREDEDEVEYADGRLHSHASCFKTDHIEADQAAKCHNCIAFEDECK